MKLIIKHFFYFPTQNQSHSHKLYYVQLFEKQDRYNLFNILMTNTGDFTKNARSLYGPSSDSYSRTTCPHTAHKDSSCCANWHAPIAYRRLRSTLHIPGNASDHPRNSVAPNDSSRPCVSAERVRISNDASARPSFELKHRISCMPSPSHPNRRCI